MHSIVFLDRATLAPDIDLRRPAFAHRWTAFDRTGADQVVERLRGATIAIVNKVPLCRDALMQLPDLRLIAVAATGTDIIDTDACMERGITVSNIRDYAVHTVPEHSFALILALRRGIVGYREDVRAGKWQESGQFCFFTHPIADLHGQTLGIVGEGAIGQSVAAIGRAFGMRVLFAAHKGSTGMGPLYTPFDRLLAVSDVVTLHCPLTPATRNLLSDREFGLMARRPIIVNTARGGLIDEAALARALRAGIVAGAGIDVCSSEPPPADHPLMALAGLPNVILTPHVAWAGRQSMQALADQLIENIEGFAGGVPRNIVAAPSAVSPRD
ncbi:D-2-hydroxyacid dehydrogenase (plasmid) [Azospirillum oryzae]|uniref:D-2-hydroxyacid dehydrogenase n=1 Tax=Azospirillum oryzae TaxID=286727 RepID=A0A6N1AQC6_9PROT|nr:D-2-hydroxyacid dehydrogenase [Azospirillum oryzae]KAA0587845.1 D-2-hydroxyacid dehydrogenase [Azospirillum oryzae]QKS53961.1 D-2-hydroxyacid dehydrogenase [Azospirillum oryzae]GLR77760.1 glycerate dehydrogenase [Azospirillum oryzae]